MQRENFESLNLGNSFIKIFRNLPQVWHVGNFSKNRVPQMCHSLQKSTEIDRKKQYSKMDLTP